MVSDHDRRELFGALERELGSAPPSTLMELLPPIGWADVARQSDLVAVRGDMAQLRGDMARLRAEMARLRAEYHALLPRLITANIASMVAFCGLILAVAAFVK